MVSVAGRGGGPTLREQAKAAEAETISAAHDDPVVQKALDLFPGSRLVGVRVRGSADGEDPAPAADPDDDEDL
jgi:hypothetical protein